MTKLKVCCLFLMLGLTLVGQSTNLMVITTNYNATEIAQLQQRGLLIPPTFQPQVQVLIIPNGPAPLAYLVTLIYPDANGITQTVSQVILASAPFPDGTESTWTYFRVNCYGRPQVTVQPLAASGAAATNSAELNEP